MKRSLSLLLSIILIMTTIFSTNLTATAAPVTVTLSKTSYTYNGKVRAPSVTVKNRNGKTLKKSTDYSVKYSDGRKKVGVYTVTVKLKGKYSGTINKNFTIKPKSTNLSKLIPRKKGFTVKWKKQTTQTTGYQIQYSTNKSFIKNKKTVTISKKGTASKKISNLKSKKKYYVRIRTYKTVKGKKIHSSWSKYKSVTTKGNSNSKPKRGTTVYITPTGKKYHYSKACAGINAIAKDLSEAKKTYDPCKKCAL